MVKLNDLAILKSDQLLQLFSATDLDAALDAAARKSSAVVAEFTATVANAEIDAPIAVEAAVEFLIPPESIALFAAEFDDQLMRRSLGYAAGRHRGDLGPAVVQVVGAGAFHQWRVAGRRSERLHDQTTWCLTREYLEGVMHQSQKGWREIARLDWEF
jgi:hypothetical protein